MAVPFWGAHRESSSGRCFQCCPRRRTAEGARCSPQRLVGVSRRRNPLLDLSPGPIGTLLCTCRLTVPWFGVRIPAGPPAHQPTSRSHRLSFASGSSTPVFPEIGVTGSWKRR